MNLTHRFGKALGTEFRIKGANAVLGPSVNVHRIARNGRHAEYISGEDPMLGAPPPPPPHESPHPLPAFGAGEDPMLGAPLAAAYVSGVQSVGVAAVAKHYALNQQVRERCTTAHVHAT